MYYRLVALIEFVWFASRLANGSIASGSGTSAAGE